MLTALTAITALLLLIVTVHFYRMLYRYIRKCSYG